MMDISPAITLPALLAANRERDWYFVKPGGNWGDYLIYAGAEYLARSAGLRWTDLDFRTFDAERIPENAGIYLHGSGGFNPWGSRRAFDMLKKAVGVRSALVIQGPQSCDTGSPETVELFRAAFAQSAASEIHLFAREAASASFLETVLPQDVRLHRDQDTAFYLDRSALLDLGQLSRLPAGRYSLFVSREDEEQPAVLPNVKRPSVVMDPAIYAISFRHWIRIHAFARSITTNRLHSAIVGALLDKPVVLMSGSYHKNRSIWEYSLQERGVTWHEQNGEPGGQGATQKIGLPPVVANSWKVQRTLMWLRGVPAS